MKLFKSHHNEKGQSLVEMAIAAPVLIIFLLGIFEVGSAVRQYLTLVNVNREITRFAIRPGYLDFSTEESIHEGYVSVKEWASNAVSGQLELDFTDTGDIDNTGTTTMIVSHLVVDTGVPCDPEDSDPCDCDGFVADPPTTTPFTFDDIIIHPGIEDYDYQAERFGPTQTVTGIRDTRLDYEAIVDELAAQNNQFNCEIIKKGGIPSSNNVIITELFFDQPQLFGFPFISNPYTDPVPLYTHTSMRLTQAARGYTAETVGPMCMAYPMIIPRSVFEDAEYGDIVDILGGAGPSNFGFLSWDPAENDENYLNLELLYFESSMNDYFNVADVTDTTLSVGDWVKSNSGAITSIDTRNNLAALANDPYIIIPVWDDVEPNGFDQLSNPLPPPAVVKAYHIYSFVKVKIIESGIDIPHKTIEAQYLGPAYECLDDE